MRRSILLVCLVLIAHTLLAQDEGTIVKRGRFERANSIFIDLGPSFTLGKNIGDYSAGFSIEAGFQRRLNRILSVGPSISFVSFEYDPEVTNESRGAYIGTGDPNGWGQKYGLNNFNYQYGYILELSGGDLSLTSLGVNLKLNFIPIKDRSKISVYGFAKPFIAVASRKAVSGKDTRYTYETYEDNRGTTNTNDDLLYYNQDDNTWYEDGYTGTWGAGQYEALEKKTKVTGGIFVGPGVEVLPNNKFSFFLQVAFGYTFPVNYVSTESYSTTITSYVDEKFPMTDKGFPSINLQFGGSFNF